MQTAVALQVNIASATDYNSGAGGQVACNAGRQISGSGVVEQINISEQSLAFYRSDPSLRTFIETAPHAIIVTDDADEIRTCNPFAEALFGYAEAEVLGKPLSKLLDYAKVPAPQSIFCSEPSSGRTVPNMEAKAFKKNGEQFQIELVTNRVMLGDTRIHIHYIRDISFRKRFEQRILELQQELIHLSQTNVLGELASAITHELNQPLQAITNYAAAARQCGCKASPEDLESSFVLMEKAASQARRAWQIMHKLRNLVQHRGVEYSLCDLRATVEDAVQLATMGIAHHGIQVSVGVPSDPVMVPIDQVQVQILLTNLVRNAVDELKKWNGEKKLWITLCVCPDNTAEVMVEDTGPGIAPEVFESIFDPFHTTKPEGLGMGLAVSRRIAEAHGGLLAAANRPDGGAVFSFSVPMSNENMGE